MKEVKQASADKAAADARSQYDDARQQANKVLRILQNHQEMAEQALRRLTQ